MEINLAGIAKLFAAANVLVVVLLVFLALKPFFGFGTFGLVINDWRYGYGSGGWVVQHVKTYEVAAQGWFPWYRWWFDRWFEKHYGRKPDVTW